MAIPISEPSGEITSSQLVHTGKCAINCVYIKTDGVNPATVTIYDNLEASGKKIRTWVVPGNANYGGQNWTFPVSCKNGIYVELSGGNSSAYIDFIDRDIRG
jgi:hypothetical protein